MATMLVQKTPQQHEEDLMSSITADLAKIAEDAPDIVVVCRDGEEVYTNRPLLGLWSRLVRLVCQENSSVLFLPDFSQTVMAKAVDLMQPGWSQETVSEHVMELLEVLGIVSPVEDDDEEEEEKLDGKKSQPIGKLSSSGLGVVPKIEKEMQQSDEKGTIDESFKENGKKKKRTRRRMSEDQIKEQIKYIKQFKPKERTAEQTKDLKLLRKMMLNMMKREMTKEDSTNTIDDDDMSNTTDDLLNEINEDSVNETDYMETEIIPEDKVPEIEPDVVSKTEVKTVKTLLQDCGKCPMKFLDDHSRTMHISIEHKGA